MSDVSFEKAEFEIPGQSNIQAVKEDSTAFQDDSGKANRGKSSDLNIVLVPFF